MQKLTQKVAKAEVAEVDTGVARLAQLHLQLRYRVDNDGELFAAAFDEHAEVARQAIDQRVEVRHRERDVVEDGCSFHLEVRSQRGGFQEAAGSKSSMTLPEGS